MIDNVQPNEKWEFNKDVADCFEDMLIRSIPQYEIMRKSVLDLSSYHIDKLNNFNLLDIGCSDGLMISRFLDKYKDKGTYDGIDISEAMLNKAKERFFNEIASGYVNIQNVDLKTDFPSKHYDIVTSILSIQFIPIEYRQNIIQRVYDSLNNGSIFIMVEKVLGNTSTLNDMFTNTYYDMKRLNGYSQDQISRKKLSLEGVLVPVTSNWNIDLLKQAGFKQVDVFWRWMNFVGYIAIK